MLNFSYLLLNYGSIIYCNICLCNGNQIIIVSIFMKFAMVVSIIFKYIIINIIINHVCDSMDFDLLFRYSKSNENFIIYIIIYIYFYQYR